MNLYGKKQQELCFSRLFCFAPVENFHSITSFRTFVLVNQWIISFSLLITRYSQLVLWQKLTGNREL